MRGEKIQTRKGSFAGRIRNITLLSSVLIVVIMAGMSYVVMKNYLVTQIKENVAQTAQIAAEQVDGDLYETIQPGEEDKEAYQQIYRQLSTFLKGDSVEYIYTMRENENDDLSFVVDTDPEEGAAIGEIYDEVVDEMYEALTGRVVTDKDITTDEWGSFLSAYAPIYNQAGEVVGIVGVDYAAGYVTEKCAEFFKRILLIALVCMGLSAVAAFVLAQTLSKRLNQVNGKLSDVVYNDGNLTKKVIMDTGDEFEVIAGNLNAMFAQTRDIVSNIKNCSGEVHDVAEHVDDTMGKAREEVGQIHGYLQDMSNGVEVTAQSLERISSMIEEVVASVSEISDRSMEGAKIAEEISDRSEQMTQNVQQSQENTVQEIDRIRQQLAENIERSKSVEQIQSFTEDILKIANQTKLLALNANIEAARAGESGRGFGVVAENIGELAADSGRAAANIQQVSGEVVDVVQEMAALSQEILKFMSDSILQEFEQMAHAGKQYAEDAAYIHETLKQFEDRIQAAEQAVNDIRGAVETAAETSTANNANIKEVSQHAKKLNDEMSYTADLAQKNREHADNLSAVVSHYQV